MKKAFALFIVTTLCAGALLPASVSGKRSQNAAAPQDDSRATVQSNAEVQFGERAVSGRVKNMSRGKDRGKHLVPDKEFEPRFDPDGLKSAGYTIDPVVQSAVPDSSMKPLMVSASAAPPSDAPTPNPSTQLLGNPGFENGSASPAPWVPTAGVINNSASEPAHSGSREAGRRGPGGHPPH